MEIIFATGNENKIKEARDLLSKLEGLEITSMSKKGITEDIPETGSTLEENARQKANYVHKNYGFNCFSEDTGLEVEALQGQPGVLSARFAGDSKDSNANIDLLLQKMQGESNRKARFRTVICLILEQEEYLFEGIANGQILEFGKGSGGFGYDPVFQPDGYKISFAEMDAASKTAISHRGKAVRKLVDFLITYTKNQK
jgi:XTP/dITP diphosphohydrolase